jgi:hypothetical protein
MLLYIWPVSKRSWTSVTSNQWLIHLQCTNKPVLTKSYSMVFLCSFISTVGTSLCTHLLWVYPYRWSCLGKHICPLLLFSSPFVANEGGYLINSCPLVTHDLKKMTESVHLNLSLILWAEGNDECINQPAETWIISQGKKKNFYLSQKPVPTVEAWWYNGMPLHCPWMAPKWTKICFYKKIPDTSLITVPLLFD